MTETRYVAAVFFMWIIAKYVRSFSLENNSSRCSTSSACLFSQFEWFTIEIKWVTMSICSNTFQLNQKNEIKAQGQGWEKYQSAENFDFFFY